MKFYGPLLILLTAFSPNLEAGYIDPIKTLTDNPYRLAIGFNNVGPSLRRADYTGTEIDFSRATLKNGVISLKGSVDWFRNGSLDRTSPIFGSIKTDTNRIKLKTKFPVIWQRWDGIVSEDFTLMGGTLRGLNRSDMTGVWAATPVEIPATLGLLVCAVGSIFLFSRAKAW